MRVSTMPRNVYTEQFKADAVTLYERHPELSYSKAAADLGIGHATLKVWVRQARKDAGKLPAQAPGAAAEAPETGRGGTGPPAGRG